jgi:predicted NBD/HSP70 family sugar kinase
VAEQYGDYGGVGVACTGQVDAAGGRIVYANRNVEGFTGTELGPLLEKRLGVPVTVDNDANAAALGEGAYGAARGTQDFLCVTYGTGVGGAIVMGGKVYGGQSGVAGEIGHILTHPGGRRCACGQRGCYEQYASVTALMRRAAPALPEIRDGRALFGVLNDRPSLREAVDAWIEEVRLRAGYAHALLTFPVRAVRRHHDPPYVLDRLEKTYAPQIMESYRPVQLRKAELVIGGEYGAFRGSRKGRRAGRNGGVKGLAEARWPTRAKPHATT